MLENLRRKSLVKTYNNPRHRIHFEKGLAKYENHVEVDVCTQRLSKNEIESSFQKVVETIPWFSYNMIYCPAQRLMGDRKIQTANQASPEVIEKPFLLGETEVTQELYDKVMDDNPSYLKNPSYFKKRPKNPVEFLSWSSAIVFCNRLSILQGLDVCYTKKSKDLSRPDHLSDWDCDFGKNGYRLPREKEWEYAAKAGTQNEWSGTDLSRELGEYAWFSGNSNGETHPVKAKKPNEWGFYDMSGNVSEWCWDTYVSTKGFDFGLDRITRGGSFDEDGPKLKSFKRSAIMYSGTSYNVGFRLARTIVE